MNVAAFLTLNAPDHPACAEVFAMHAALEPRERATPSYWKQRIRQCIVSGDEAGARALLDGLPVGMRGLADLAQMDAYLRRNDADPGALRRIWQRQVAETAPNAITAPTAPPLPLRLTWQGTAGDVLLFAVVQNGIEYLPWLVDYYRRLGVDHLFIVDNASDDGGLEWLLKRAETEGDVSVFSQAGSFRQAAFGVAWTNHLMQRFGIGHWCFHVDMDEAFVFPGMDEGRTLRDLLAYLDATGAESVGAFMLDIYPERLDAPAQGDAFAESTLIDDDYRFIPFETPPYRFVLGGLRARLAGSSILMTKAPLVRMRPDLFFLTNNHFHTGARMADLSAALLHYKYVGDLAGRVAEQIARKEHFMGARYYKRLQPGLEETAVLASTTSLRYTGPSQLVELGYMDAPDRWRSRSAG